MEAGILRRRDIEIAWQNQAEALIDSGLGEGDLLVLTPLGQVTSGVRVAISKRTLQAGHAMVSDAVEGGAQSRM